MNPRGMTLSTERAERRSGWPGAVVLAAVFVAYGARNPAMPFEPTGQIHVPAAPSERDPPHSPAERPDDDRRIHTLRVAEGQCTVVVAEALTHGLEKTLAHASLTELATLADAARYTHESAIARRALLAERSRFPGTSEANTAAFLLGAIAEDAESPKQALVWYDRYLEETASRGPLVAETLGRKMVVVVTRSGTRSGRRAAASTASEYVRRFPNGPYARVAHELASSR